MNRSKNIRCKKRAGRTALIYAFPQVLLIVPIAAVFLMMAYSHAGADDRGKKDYWINNYGLLKENEYTRRAHDVFRRVLAASDRRAGVEPALYITNFNGTPWAQALADGSIILSRNGLELCYRNHSPLDGDSRMAFVIGHELAHQFNSDFWHYRFLRTAEADSGKIRAFQDIKNLAKNKNMLLSKELQADQYGIIYSTLAGYESDKIISKDKNFFLEWAKKETLPGSHSADILSLSEKRAQVVSMRLAEVASRIVLFDLGVISYHIERFDDSLMLFRKFASYFPGREVYTNIGTIYLQTAYNKFRAARPPGSFPFALSFGIEKTTRAETINIASSGVTAAGYTEYNDLLRIAVNNLKKAIGYDPFYHEAKNNLGCAYIIATQYYDAVSTLEGALTLAPDSARIRNNLGIAYLMLGQTVESSGLRKKAEEMLRSAKERNRKALANFNSFQRMYGNDETMPELRASFTAPLYDTDIEMMSVLKLKPGMTVSGEESLHLVEEVSDSAENKLMVYKKPEENIFMLTMGKRIRLLLYREPANLKTSIKGGEEKRVYISSRWRNGIVMSGNRSPDYFEF